MDILEKRDSRGRYIKGNMPYMTGKHHKESSNKKNHDSHLGMSPSFETRLKISKSSKNKIIPKEVTDKIVATRRKNNSYVHTKEQDEKIADTLRILHKLKITGTKLIPFKKWHVSSNGFQKGAHISRKTEFQKGNPTWNKNQKMEDLIPNYVNPFQGKKHTEEFKQKKRLQRLNQVFPNKDSLIERMLQEELIKRNIQFKKHVPLIGQPDIFIEPNVCIFADGTYVHGDLRKYGYDDLTMNGMTVKEKQLYDWNVTLKLTEQNYFVMRFWEKEIKSDIKSIGDEIEKIIK